MQIDVAVIGATGAVGEAILEQLAGRHFPCGRVLALDGSESRRARVAYGERWLTVQPADELDFTGTRLVFCCPGTDRTTAQRARAGGCVLIDSAGLYRADPSVPLVVPGVSPEALSQVGSSGVIAVPDGPATQLAEALAPLRARVGLARVDVLTCRSVAARGTPGVEELAGQTAQLLNGRPAKPGVFARQIAFNLLGQDGAQGADGLTDSERDLVSQVNRLLGADLEVNATTIIAPVFHGDAQVVHLQTQAPLSRDEALALWRAVPGIEVAGSSAEAACPTPVSDAALGETLWIGRARASRGRAPGLQFWSVSDCIRRSHALNSVQIAEILVKAHL